MTMNEPKKKLAVDLAPIEVQWLYAHVVGLERSAANGGGGIDRGLMMKLLPRLRTALAALGGL
jgi:hypothetical protein